MNASPERELKLPAMEMLLQDTDNLIEELRKLFRERYTKIELMRALAARLKNYPQLKGTPFQSTINNFILFNAEDSCEVLIHDDEIGKIWEG